MPPEAAHPTSPFSTQRVDAWWVQPLAVFLLLSGFVVYATFRIFEGNTEANRFFEVDNGSYHYLSPFGTPDLTFLVPGFLAGLPVVGVFLQNPAFLVLPLPAGFRFTCYYYRKAYYRSFVARPSACNVEAVRGLRYKGERGLMVLQNVHRYFLYLAILVLLFLTYDALRGIWTPHGLYFGVGNVIMLVNVALLAAYTFGCHSFRHLVGGRLDCYSCDALSQTRHKWWEYVTKLNLRHGTWAMASLVSVAATDLYIRWVGMNHVTTVWGLPA